MKKRIAALLLALALLAVPMFCCAEQGAGTFEYRNVLFVVNDETVVPTDAEGNPILLLLVDGVLYAPVGTVPGLLGVDCVYDAETGKVYIGQRQEEEVHGLYWVRTGMEFEVEESGHDGDETYGFEGAVDGKARFVRSGGYRGGEKWGVCSGTYECEIPPEYIRPGR